MYIYVFLRCFYVLLCNNFEIDLSILEQFAINILGKNTFCNLKFFANIKQL